MVYDHVPETVDYSAMRAFQFEPNIIIVMTIF